MGTKIKSILLAALLVVGFAPSAHAILAAVSPQVDGVNGYPLWYQDTNGLAVQLCLDPAACLFDPVVPGNDFSAAIGFGAEAFYWSGEADITPLGADGSALLVMALEAAWLNEDPVSGEQIVFGRVRIRIDAPTGTPAGTWTINHPFGVLVVDGPAAGAGLEVNETSDIGCFAAPCDFSLALQSDVGPFLIAQGFPAVIGTGTFLGDAATPLPLAAPGPNGSEFTISGPGGVSGSTNLFVIQGQVSPIVVAMPLTVERATYSRTGVAGAVNVIAHSTAAANVSFTGGPNLPAGALAMTGDGAGSFFRNVPLADASVLPANVTVTATDPAAVLADASVLRPLVDVVTISRAAYNLSSQTLVVGASSSDRGALPPTLTAAGFGALVNGALTVPAVAVPPGTVTVNSSAGGSDTQTVQIVNETLNVTEARRRAGRRLVVAGTTTVPGPGNTITIRLGDAAGPVIGTTEADALGNFLFDQRRIDRALLPAGRGGTVTAVSSFGTAQTATLPLRP
jgi:hypothetical protein